VSFEIEWICDRRRYNIREVRVCVCECSMLDMFFPHVKAEASASPELPFPLYSFGSMTYDDPDPVAFLPPASRTVRRRSSKGLLCCVPSSFVHVTHLSFLQPVTSAASPNASASARLLRTAARTVLCSTPVRMFLCYVLQVYHIASSSHSLHLPRTL